MDIFVIKHFFMTLARVLHLHRQVPDISETESALKGHNWMHHAIGHIVLFPGTVALNSNFAILKTSNCFQLE